ncbi:MAG: BON domain-containing protein [Rhodoferax sp.]|nr:BON domain-containing protein [Rhodoferax sp.]
MKPILQKTVLALALAASVLALTACFPLLVGGAFTGALVVSDRRTSGTVVEDNGIQIKAHNRIQENLGERVHINITSYNRKVLLTGEVPTEQDRQLAAKLVRGVENVQGVYNELAVQGNSTFSQQSNDTLVTATVKAAIIDAKDLVSNAVKVVTERGNVYLLGRVTPREADRFVELVRAQDGVHRLVLLWEKISEEDLARMTPPATPVEPDKP